MSVSSRREELGKIGPYKLLECLAKVPLCKVFLAYDPKKKRQVVIKTLAADMAENEWVKAKFIEQAKMQKALEHPGVVPVYQIGQRAKLPYFTMAYIEGKTLKEIFSKVRKEAIEAPISYFIGLFVQICEVVRFIHAHNILHMDLKPKNFIVGNDGVVRLLDFELATRQTKDLADELPIDKMGLLAGTKKYFAPELLLQAEIPTYRSEIYSLGLILYEMLTLRFPFRRETLQDYMHYFERERLPDPELLAPFRGVTPHLSRIVKKCLAWPPQERYETVDALLEDIKLALKEPVQAILQDEVRYENFLAHLKAQMSVEEAKKELFPLKGTPAAILYYLGLAALYEVRQDLESEIEAFEILFKRFSNHPWIARAKMQLRRRVEVTSGQHQFALLALRFIVEENERPALSLQPVYFINAQEQASLPWPMWRLSLIVHLAYSVKRADILAEVIDDATSCFANPLPIIEQAFFALLELEAFELAQEKLDRLMQSRLEAQSFMRLHWIQEVARVISGDFSDTQMAFLSEFPKVLGSESLNPLFCCLRATIRKKRPEVMQKVLGVFKAHQIPEEAWLTVFE